MKKTISIIALACIMHTVFGQLNILGVEIEQAKSSGTEFEAVSPFNRTNLDASTTNVFKNGAAVTAFNINTAEYEKIESSQTLRLSVPLQNETIVLELIRVPIILPKIKTEKIIIH